MVSEFATGTCSLLRGTSFNQFGDQIDADVPVIASLPCAIIETGKTTQDPSSQTPRTIREIVAYVPQYAGAITTDRIRDDATGDVFIIISVTTPPTLIGAPVDTVLGLKRVTATTS
jgi:hypothetical protein